MAGGNAVGSLSYARRAVRGLAFAAGQAAAMVECEVPAMAFALDGATWGDDLRALAAEADRLGGLEDEGSATAGQPGCTP